MTLVTSETRSVQDVILDALRTLMTEHDFHFSLVPQDDRLDPRGS